jgi:hypothetical protein
MKNGIFIQVDGNWMVESNGIKLPIFDRDLILLENYAILPGDTIDFEIIDEFSHPQLFTHIGWGDGITCAKLKLEDHD